MVGLVEKHPNPGGELLFLANVDNVYDAVEKEIQDHKKRNLVNPKLPTICRFKQKHMTK